MLSVSAVIFTDTVVLGLDTTTVKMKVPPGADKLIGLADLVTAITGAPGTVLVVVGATLVLVVVVGATVVLVVVVGGGVRVTVAWAVAVAVLPLESTPWTVTVSVWLAPETPMKEPGNVHGADDAPGASVTPISVPQVEPASVAKLPYTLSTSEVILTGSVVLGLVTCTVKV